MVSGLKLHSLGIVVETKPDGTDFILVTPIEELNIQTPGSIKEFTKDYKGQKKELESKNFKTEHEAKNYIRARWLPFGHSNRITAPDVVVNETVILFKFGDVDEFYWTTIFREPELRRLETVLYAYSNVRGNITSESFDKTKSYWAEVSTKEKYIHIHTAKNDGEPFEYDVVIDTKTGFINMRDDVGNFIELNSPSNTITLRALNMINLDAPIINMRSANGAMSADNNGIRMEGNEVKAYTTVADRTVNEKANQIDDTHSRGELRDRYTAPIIDIGHTNKGLTETNIIGDRTYTNSPNIETDAVDIVTRTTTMDTTAVDITTKSTTIDTKASSITTQSTDIATEAVNIETESVNIEVRSKKIDSEARDEYRIAVPQLLELDTRRVELDGTIEVNQLIQRGGGYNE